MNRRTRNPAAGSAIRNEAQRCPIENRNHAAAHSAATTWSIFVTCGVLFSMWVTFAAGYQSVYQALILVLAGVVVYAFLKAHREDTGQVPAPADPPAGDRAEA